MVTSEGSSSVSPGKDKSIIEQVFDAFISQLSTNPEYAIISRRLKKELTGNKIPSEVKIKAALYSGDPDDKT